MSEISEIYAREILDSRGKPTVEVDLRCADGSFGRAMVPSGASTGKAEALELRDTQSSRYDGQGVLRAVQHVKEKIAPTLIGFPVNDQFAIDTQLKSLDESPGYRTLGANAVLAVSLAASHAAAASQEIPLWQHFHLLNTEAAQRASAKEATVISSVGTPGKRFANTKLEPSMPIPMVNMISGGLHAGGKIPFQDFLIIPVSAESYSQGLEWIVRIYRRLGEVLKSHGYEAALVGDEGGYGPALKSEREAAELILEAIEKAELKPTDDIVLALDVAASHFYADGFYHVNYKDKNKLTAQEMVDYLEEFAQQYPVISIEDGLAEDDWDGWKLLTDRLSSKVWLVGDDLFTTNPKRLLRGMHSSIANSVLVKVNQIGTVTEALQTIALARLADYGVVVSARSGETEDTTIADLAVGCGCGQIKIGSIVRSERLAKYNRLLRIEEEMQHFTEKRVAPQSTELNKS